MFRTSNPILTGIQSARGGTGVMTVDGTVSKTGMLVGLVALAAMLTWGLVGSGQPGVAMGLGVVGTVVGLGVGIALMFRPIWASTLAPIYAIGQGLFMGTISSVLEAQAPGVVIQAVGLTIGTLVCMLGVYKSGLIKVTDKFRMGMMAATGGIMVVYFVAFIASMFGASVGFLTQGTPFGIALSLVVVTIAALNLVLDFDFVVQGAASGAPKHMEWIGAFGLIVTLVWLYIEILRLLMKMRNRE